MTTMDADACVVDTEESFTIDQVLALMRACLPSFSLLDETKAVASLLQDLVQQHNVRGRQIHDANIVATMLTHGIPRLVTYNQGDFERFDEITVEPAPL